ncbi:MAG TPA: glycosyltransferase family 2 protein [Aggregatilineaceae bacterium]|jgi:GT2 family glycosyltransferase|nr:glycosyltransferase family 2 protein [Aggregatilineaceae bacterium]
MQLTTVICNYNTCDALARALESLLATTGDLDHEIIVVDNASQDGSADIIRERFPSVRLIESGANLWFAGGNNLGIRAAQGDYVYVLNPDTVIQPSALHAMTAYLDSHPEVGAVTSRMIFGDGTLQRNCSRFATYTDLLLGYTFLGLILRPWRERRRQIMWYADWDRATDHAVQVAPDSNLMVRRPILEQIGCFDENLKLYFTEDDLCYRIINSGHAIHYVAGATIVHDEHASVSQAQRLATQVYFNDLITYTRKYHGGWASAALAALIFPTRAGMNLRARLREWLAAC